MITSINPSWSGTLRRDFSVDAGFENGIMDSTPGCFISLKNYTYLNNPEESSDEFCTLGLGQN